MSYYDVPKGNPDLELGRQIYMDALSGRIGFRDDQVGIEDAEIWADIFEEIGVIARAAVTNGY
jgi:hypothetical protein